MTTINHTVVVYHRDCADGTAAAWAAWKRLGDAGVVYLPMGYDAPQNGAAHGAIAVARTVYFVDFSWKRKPLLMLCANGHDVVVLDHHKTAQAELAGIEDDRGGRSGKIRCVFDMNRSGARIAWDHFHSEGQRPIHPYRGGVPRLIQYVEDRDLWRFALPHSRGISAYIRSHHLTVADYEGIDYALHADLDACVDTGVRLLAAQNMMVDGLAREAAMQDVLGHCVPVCNVPQATLVQSEVCDALLRQMPDQPFAAVYADISKRRRRWSLRSRPRADGSVFDVAALAKTQGGGGHTQAAGFTVDLP